jgi:hypothetical protein
MNINKNATAVVDTDPQNDVLSEKGITWGLVGNRVKEYKTVENIERIVKAAKKRIRGLHHRPVRSLRADWAGDGPAAVLGNARHGSQPDPATTGPDVVCP